MIIFLELFSPSQSRIFFVKNYQNIKFGKVIKYMTNDFLKKKRFPPFERHLQQNWKVENMPVIAGRLDLFKL